MKKILFMLVMIFSMVCFFSSCDNPNNKIENPAEEESPAEEKNPAEDENPVEDENPAEEESPAEDENNNLKFFWFNNGSEEFYALGIDISDKFENTWDVQGKTYKITFSCKSTNGNIKLRTCGVADVCEKHWNQLTYNWYQNVNIEYIEQKFTLNSNVDSVDIWLESDEYTEIYDIDVIVELSTTSSSSGVQGVKDNYRTKTLDLTYLYNKLTPKEQKMLDRYEYVVVYDTTLINLNGRKVYGVTFQYDKVVMSVDIPNNWYGTGYTETDKIFIHEMAHVLEFEKTGGSSHRQGWAMEVKNLLEHLIDNEKLRLKCLNDIMVGYNMSFDKNFELSGEGAD